MRSNALAGVAVKQQVVRVDQKTNARVRYLVDERRAFVNGVKDVTFRRIQGLNNNGYAMVVSQRSDHSAERDKLAMCYARFESIRNTSSSSRTENNGPDPGFFCPLHASADVVL